MFFYVIGKPMNIDNFEQQQQQQQKKKQNKSGGMSQSVPDSARLVSLPGASEKKNNKKNNNNSEASTSCSRHTNKNYCRKHTWTWVLDSFRQTNEFSLLIVPITVKRAAARQGKCASMRIDKQCNATFCLTERSASGAARRWCVQVKVCRMW
jgi:hypothetical protein